MPSWITLVWWRWWSGTGRRRERGTSRARWRSTPTTARHDRPAGRGAWLRLTGDDGVLVCPTRRSGYQGAGERRSGDERGDDQGDTQSSPPAGRLTPARPDLAPGRRGCLTYVSEDVDGHGEEPHQEARLV